MNPKTAAAGLTIAVLLAAVIATCAACIFMIYTKKGLGKPYTHPDKPGEFKPLGKIIDLTPEQRLTRKKVVDSQVKPTERTQ